MSRNRCDTACACGANFHYQTKQLDRDDKRLLVFEDYLREIGMDPETYPYAPANFSHDIYRRSGTTFQYWRRRDGMGGGTYHRSASDPDFIADFTTWATVPPEHRLRFALVECPRCGSRYAGWYELFPPVISGPNVYEDDSREWRYALVDTSYWSTYNDEPGQEDGPKR